MENPVVEQQGGTVTIVSDDLAKYAGMGMEGADANDFAIPFAHILQKLSPQVDEDSPTRIEGAKSGQIFITTTGQRLDRKVGFLVIPCAFKKNMVEWKPRTSGGGYVKEHQWNGELIAQTQKNDKNQNVLPNGNLLVETKMHYVLVKSDEGWFPAVITMTSTQLKKSRKWMALIGNRKLKTADGKQFIPPSFAFYYHLTTVMESNDSGNWYNWEIEPKDQVNDPLLIREALKFHKAVNAGEVKVVDNSPSLQAADDDDIPF